MTELATNVLYYGDNLDILRRVPHTLCHCGALAPAATLFPRLRRPPGPAPRGGPMTELATNVLSYGDNLDILRRYLPDAQLLKMDP